VSAALKYIVAPHFLDRIQTCCEGVRHDRPFWGNEALLVWFALSVPVLDGILSRDFTETDPESKGITVCRFIWRNSNEAFRQVRCGFVCEPNQTLHEKLASLMLDSAIYCWNGCSRELRSTEDIPSRE